MKVNPFLIDELEALSNKIKSKKDDFKLQEKPQSGSEPPPLPSRAKLEKRQNTSSLSEKAQIRQNSLLAGQPVVRRKDSLNSLISTDSYASSGRSFSISIDSESLNDENEENPDPVSRCLPIVDEDFVEHLDEYKSEIDFSIIDEYARDTPKCETVSVTRLANYLTSVWDEEIYKLRALFAWITDNISYDCEAFYSGRVRFKSAKDVLKSRTAVCGGYAELFYDLAYEVNLKVWKINGNAKGAGYQAGDIIGPDDNPHAWNGTCYKGEYLLIDCTWGAGCVSNKQFKKGFNPYYFLAPPTQFIYSHFPSSQKEQYLQPPLIRTEFNNHPYYQSMFFIEGFRYIRYVGSEIKATNDNITLDLEQTKIDGKANAIIGKLEWNGQVIPTFSQRLAISGQNGGIIYRLRIGCPTRDEGKLNIFYMREGEKEYQCMSSIKINNQGTGAKYKPFVQTYNVPFPCTIIKPINLTLDYSKRTRFEVILFNQDVGSDRYNNKDTPEILVSSPRMEKKQYLEQVFTRHDEQGCITMACETTLNYKGSWNLMYRSGDNLFSYIASYDVK